MISFHLFIIWDSRRIVANIAIKSILSNEMRYWTVMKLPDYGPDCYWLLPEVVTRYTVWWLVTKRWRPARVETILLCTSKFVCKGMTGLSTSGLARCANKRSWSVKRVFSLWSKWLAITMWLGWCKSLTPSCSYIPRLILRTVGLYGYHLVYSVLP